MNAIEQNNIDQVKFVRQIGEGSYGKVFHIQRGNLDLAWKIMVNDRGAAIDSISELDIMNRLRHPYLMPALRTFTTDLSISNPEVLTTPASLKTLKNWTVDHVIDNVPMQHMLPSKVPAVLNHSPRNENVPAVIVEMPFAVEQMEKFITKFEPPTTILIRWMYEIATAIDFLHQNNILHLDIKLDNILVSKVDSWAVESFKRKNNSDIHEYKEQTYPSPDSFSSFKAVLIDFSLSMVCTETEDSEFKRPFRKSRRLRITPNYCPLEIYDSGRAGAENPKIEINYNSRNDVWSFGMLMLKIFSDVDPILYNYSIDKPNGDIKTYIEKMIRKNFETLPKVEDFVNSHVIKRNLSIGSETYLSQLRSLIIRCLNPDISSRPFSNQIVSDQLFRDLLGVSEENRARGILRIPQLKGIKMIRTAHYAGMGYMIKLCKNWKVKIETYFLAADLYQRSLYYAPEVTGDQVRDLNNFTLWGTCCFWIAHSMLEEYCGNPLTLKNIYEALGKKFSKSDIITTERKMINHIEGLIYFQSQKSVEKSSILYLTEKFELSRDLFNYRGSRDLFDTGIYQKRPEILGTSDNISDRLIIESPECATSGTESPDVNQIFTGLNVRSPKRNTDSLLTFDQLLKRTEYFKFSTKKWNDYKNILNLDNKKYKENREIS